MRYAYLSLILVLTVLFCLQSPSVAVGGTVFHKLTVSIDPTAHEIKAIDIISNSGSNVNAIFSAGKNELILAPNLTVTVVRADGIEIPFEKPSTEAVLTFELESPAKEVSIEYSGQIYDEVRKSTTLTFVRGDDTTGLISPQGVFLTPASQWYPVLSNQDMALFQLNITMHGGLKTVSQGALSYRKSSEGVEDSEWISVIPSDGLVLVAGRYSVKSKTVDGIIYSVYLSEANKHLADRLIDASIEDVSFYGNILGPYPFSQWSVVENFFSSGYGMPGFTLLDPRVVAQGSRILKPGYIDHEIVHSWFGNYVYPEYEKGNWAEAITTYLTNYYFKEVKEGSEAALRYRIQTMESFSIMVSADRDYPLRSFSTKREEFESDIGYGKGSMVFHLLRRKVGDETFFKGLQKVITRFGGRRASWNDFRLVFEKLSGMRLKFFFRQWLDRKGGPRLLLQSASMHLNETGDYTVTGRIVQEGKIYRLELPLVIMTGFGRITETITVKDKVTDFNITSIVRPDWIAIDPDYHVFRIIYRQDLHPTLNRLLESSTQSYLMTEEVRTFDGEVDLLFNMLKDRKGGWVIPEDDLMDALGTGSVLIVGRPDSLGLGDLGLPALEFKHDGFVFQGAYYNQPEEAILYSMNNPFMPGSVVTIYAGNSPGALSRAEYIPYYGDDTYVIFRAGKPLKRGYIEFLGPKSSHRF